MTDHLTWQWYVARPNELFIDMDRYEQSIDHVRRRLTGAIECKSLSVRAVSLFPSVTKNHAHLIVVLDAPLLAYERYAWEMLLHSDIYRACSNILRESRGVPSPDVLICKGRYELYSYTTNVVEQTITRTPDAECDCLYKHNRATMEMCQAAIHLRGERRTDTFFGKPSNQSCEFLK